MRAITAWASASATMYRALPSASIASVRPGQLGAVDELDHERAEHEGAERADDADRGDDDHQPPQPGRGTRRTRPWPASRLRRGQQRGLHGLEHEQRDPGQQHAVGELRDLGVLVGLGEQRRGDRAGVEQGGGEDRAEQQPAEVRRDLAPRRVGARVGAQTAARVHVSDADQRRQGDGEPVRADGL